MLFLTTLFGTGLLVVGWGLGTIFSTIGFDCGFEKKSSSSSLSSNKVLAFPRTTFKSCLTLGEEVDGVEIEFWTCVKLFT